VGIVAHGAHVAEAGADVAYAGYGGGYARDEVEAKGDVDGCEERHDEQVAEDIAEGVVYLLVGTHTAIYADGPDAVGADCERHFPVDSLGGEDCPVYLDSSGGGTGATAEQRAEDEGGHAERGP